MGSRKWEVGSGKSEVGSEKSEVGSGKWEVGRPHRAFVMESTIVVGDSQCKYLWRYSNAPLIQAFSGYTFSDFRHSSDIEIQHGFADAKVCEHYS